MRMRGVLPTAPTKPFTVPGLGGEKGVAEAAALVMLGAVVERARAVDDELAVRREGRARTRSVRDMARVK